MSGGHTDYLPDSLADAPENVLLHVFNFLNYEDLCLGVRPVCRRWRRLTFDPTLWRYIDVPQHFSDRRFMALMSTIHKHAVELECSKCENLSDRVFNELASLDLMKLKKLAMPIVSSCSDTQFIKLMGACDCLEDVSNIRSNLQENCNPLYCQLLFPHIKVCYDKPISTYGRIRKIVPAFDQRKLDQWLGDMANFGRKRADQIHTYECIRGTDFVNEDGIETVSKTFPKLTSINIKQCNFTDEGLKKFFEHNTSPHGLLEVELDKPGNLTDKGIKMIADFCPNLLRIKIARAVKVSNEGINYLLIHCPKLRYVHFNNNVALYEEPDPDKADLDNTCLETAGIHCKRLETFSLFYSKSVDFQGVEDLTGGCPHLMSLMFFDCPGICDKALDAIMQLRFLKAMVLVNCEKITPKGVIKMILTSSNLIRMTLYCNNIMFYADQSQLADETYQLIDAAGSNYRPNILRKLTLRGVGSGFTQLITVLCPELHTVDIREANYVTNLALRSVMRNCELLRSFDVAALTLDAEFLSDLCRLAPNLCHLTLGNSLRECDRANDGLAEIIRKCPSLSEIGLNNPDYHINERFITHVAKKHHGGHCVLHVDPDADEDAKHRFIDLHFTPIKYLGSVTTTEYKEEYIDLPPPKARVESSDEEVSEETVPAASETDLRNLESSTPPVGWVNLPIGEDPEAKSQDSQLRVTMDVPFLQAALETLQISEIAATSEASGDETAPRAEEKAAGGVTAPAAQSCTHPEPPLALQLGEVDRDLKEAQAKAEAAVTAASSQQGLSLQNQMEAINDIINFLTLALDDSGRQGDLGAPGAAIDIRFLQSALDTVQRLTSDNRAAEVHPCVPVEAPPSPQPAEPISAQETAPTPPSQADDIAPPAAQEAVPDAAVSSPVQQQGHGEQPQANGSMSMSEDASSRNRTSDEPVQDPPTSCCSVSMPSNTTESDTSELTPPEDPTQPNGPDVNVNVETGDAEPNAQPSPPEKEDAENQGN